MLLDCKITSDLLPERWSNDYYGENFREAYRVFEDSPSTKSGCTYLVSRNLGAERILHWETSDGIVCLRDISVHNALENSAVCIRLGASEILHTSVKSSLEGARHTVTVAFVQQDGNVHRLLLASDDGVSVLNHLVLTGEGRLVPLGGVTTAEIPAMRLSSKARAANLHVRDEVAEGSMSVEFGLVQTLPADRDILCATWGSPDTLVLGLSLGDILLVHMQPERSESGLKVGKQLRLREQLLKDRGGGLQALWSDFMGHVADANGDTISVSALSASALAVNRSGELRLWNSSSRQLIAHAYLYDLLDAVGAAGALARRADPAEQQHVDRNIHLQDCMQSLCEDISPANGGKYFIGALAVLPETPVSTGINHRSTVVTANGAWGVVPESHLPHGQQAWQILLVAWDEAEGLAASAAASPQLICQPIRFPVDSLVSSQEGLLSYRYCAASLQDVQLVVDLQRGVASVLTVWRAEASRVGVDGEVQRITLDGLVGRSELSLQALRNQSYVPVATSGGPPSSIDELQAPSEMTLVSQSAAHDMHRLRSEDAALSRLRADRWAASAADFAFLDLEEKRLKTEMLQRIFLRRRFSKRAICVAHDAFSSKLRTLMDHAPAVPLAVDFDRMDWQDGGDLPQGSHKARHLLDQRTALAELPSLVLDLCESSARVRFQGGVALLDAATAERDMRRRGQYLQLLQDTFTGFLSECETATARFNRPNRGCVAGAVREGVTVVAMAHRCGEVSLIRPSSFDAQGVPPSPTQPATQAHKLMCELERQFASSAALASNFTELDCLLGAFLQDGDISEGGVLWIEQYFATLSPAFRDLVPVLAGIMQPVSVSNSSCLDLLSSFDTVQSLEEFAEDAFQRLGQVGGGKRALAGSSCAAAEVLLEEIVLLSRQRLHKIKLVLCLLFLLKDIGRALLSRETYGAICNIYIPKALNSLVHYSLVLWLDTRLAASNSMLQQEVELTGIFPLSSLVTSSDSTSSLQPDCTLSVLENAVRFLCADQKLSVLSIMSALQPSVHSVVSVYLFQSGQYVGSSRWAAVARLHLAADSPDDTRTDGPLARVMPVMCVLRARLAQLTAEYFELLRCQWFSGQLRAASTAMSGSSALVSAIRAKGSELVGATQELGVLAAELMQEACYSSESAMATPSLSPAKTSQTTFRTVGAAIHASLYAQWQMSFAALRATANMEELSGAAAFLEGLLALSDASQFLVNTSASDSFFAALAISSGEDVGLSSSASLLRQPSELCTALHLSGLSCVLEIIDRSLPLLPREEGAALALEGALLQVEQITNSLDAMAQRSNGLDRSSTSQSLVVELHGAWSRVFEYSLWHGSRYCEALEALLQLAELEEQRLMLRAGSLPATGITWRDCLRTLVAQACENGQLGWLCSVPDRQLLGYARRGLSLSEAVAATLEVLATTLETPSTQQQPSSLLQPVNFFECLFVYQLNRRNYHDAARVMHQFVERSAQDSTGAAGYIAAALTSLAVLPADQAFLLLRSGIATDPAPSSSALPKSPIRQLDVEQLHLIFARTCAASTLRDTAASCGHSSAEQNVLSLCNMANLHGALSLAAVEDRARATSNSATLLVDVAVMALAKLCVIQTSTRTSNLFCKLKTDAFLHAPYALPCAPTLTAPDSSQHGYGWWHMLGTLLRHVGRSGGEKRSRHYASAVRALLTFHVSEGFDGSQQLQLPRSLTDAFAGCPQSGPEGEGEGEGGDPGALIRLLVEFGSLEDACLLAARLIHEANAGHITNRVQLRTCLPYTLFDSLIVHCQQQLLRLGLSAVDDHARLKLAFDALSNNLEQHFALLILS